MISPWFDGLGRPWREVRKEAKGRGLINEERIQAAFDRLESHARAPVVTVEEATPEASVRIAIRELEKALARPDHFGVYIHSALIWLRGLDGCDDCDAVKP